MTKFPPINSAARNAHWRFYHEVAPRFPGAPTITELTGSYEPPAFTSLPDGMDVEVEFYGGASRVRLDGDLLRVYIARFVYVRFASYMEAVAALAHLWAQIKALDSAADIERALGCWWHGWAEDRRSMAGPSSADHGSGRSWL